MTAAMLDLLAARTLPHAPSSVRAAREEIREHAAGIIADEDVLYDVTVLVSEAVTNAYVHGTGEIILTISHVGDRLRVEVRDHGPRPLPLRDDRGDNGRGMDLLKVFAARWGLEMNEHETCLWFEVAIP